MNVPNPPDVSIVVPLYDEAENVEPLCAAVRAALAVWDRSWELIVVDDGSTDGTAERLAREAERDVRVRLITLRANRGQTEAMAVGFGAARGAVVISMDGDLQNDPEDIPRMAARLEQGFDLVCGWRRRRQDRWISRVLPSRAANWILARLTGIPVHDNGCSLKAYRGELIRSLRLYSNMHRFLPALSSLAGARIAEVEVRHHPRLRGRNKYGITRTFGVMADIVTLKMLTRFATRPGAWFAWLALPWLVLGIAVFLLWLPQIGPGGPAPSIVLPVLGMLTFYAALVLLGLSVLSELFLAHADRRYLRRLVEVLTVEYRAGRPVGEVDG